MVWINDIIYILGFWTLIMILGIIISKVIELQFIIYSYKHIAHLKDIGSIREVFYTKFIHNEPHDYKATENGIADLVHDPDKYTPYDEKENTLNFSFEEIGNKILFKCFLKAVKSSPDLFNGYIV